MAVDSRFVDDWEESKIRCSFCGNCEEYCDCSECVICLGHIEKETRVHCTHCKRPCCLSRCSQSRCLRFLDDDLQLVCDSCGVRSGLSILCEFPPNAFLVSAMPSTEAHTPFLKHAGRNAQKSPSGLRWGLYALRCAAALPRRCIMPHSVLTHREQCWKCNGPTVPTAPHVPRSVEGSPLADHDRKRLSVHYPRTFNVVSLTDAKKVMCSLHPFNEDAFCFHGIINSWDILFSSSAIDVAYEYSRLPSVSMRLSGSPYTQLLALESSGSGYSLFEGPKKKKFIAVPGTHNLRTRVINAKIELVERYINLPKNFKFVSSDTRTILRDHSNVHQDPSGRFVWTFSVHQGFAGEEATISLPIQRLLKWIQDGYEIVFCGHSQGGAVATLLTFQLLEAYTAAAAARPPLLTSNIPIRCVTFGSPFIGDPRLHQCVHACGWTSSFHHIVLYGDPVPSLMAQPSFGLAARGIRACDGAIKHFVSPTWAPVFNIAKNLLLSLPQDHSRKDVREPQPLAPKKDSHKNPGSSPFPTLEKPTLLSSLAEAASEELLKKPPLVYQAFGQYHFLFWGIEEEYISSKDPETVKQLLQSNISGKWFDKHTLQAYHTGILLHVCSRPLWYGM